MATHRRTDAPNATDATHRRAARMHGQAMLHIHAREELVLSLGLPQPVAQVARALHQAGGVVDRPWTLRHDGVGRQDGAAHRAVHAARCQLAVRLQAIGQGRYRLWCMDRGGGRCSSAGGGANAMI